METGITDSGMWYEKYRDASKPEVIVQALEACSRHDCGRCLYQGKGIRCADRLKTDAAKLLDSLTAVKKAQLQDNC